MGHIMVVIVWQLDLQLPVLWVRIPLRRGVLDTTLCDKVCLWLATGQWFSLVSSTNKTDCHVITDILLKVALNTITLTLFWVEVNLCRFITAFCFLISVLLMEIQLSLIRRGSHYNGLTFLFLSEARTLISKTIFHGLFCVKLFEVRGDCWYWWNCWPSLFKLSFHDIFIMYKMNCENLKKYK